MSSLECLPTTWCLCLHPSKLDPASQLMEALDHLWSGPPWCAFAKSHRSSMLVSKCDNHAHEPIPAEQNEEARDLTFSNVEHRCSLENVPIVSSLTPCLKYTLMPPSFWCPYSIKAHMMAIYNWEMIRRLMNGSHKFTPHAFQSLWGGQGIAVKNV